MSNRLKNETSPYLLQHAENPVDWYPWGSEAFQKAKDEDKPIFLSIGYSTCHWCHVMAHESFENEEIAAILNEHFVAIKVDKEERPDIDSIYMTVCQSFTGSGGWPTSIFMTPEQKPFFAGTYFPPASRGRMVGMKQLLTIISDKWADDIERRELISQADRFTEFLRQDSNKDLQNKSANMGLADEAAELYKKIYDKENGGFGTAPKFPTAHNLLFLLQYYKISGDPEALEMVQHTLEQMYRGGMFDHIGYGFSRYSTDEKFLVPHFEKMLYDNALLMMAYAKAYEVTKKPFFLEVAEKIAYYILREMTSEEGAFYSAQDADSDGEEGKFYVFKPCEIIDLLGERDGTAFNKHFDITDSGNFEGRNIPNLLGSDVSDKYFEKFFEKLREYRKVRNVLHLDDKVLASWNGLMIAAMSMLYKVSGKEMYLEAAKCADEFVRKNMSTSIVEKDTDGTEHGKYTLFVSYRDGKQGAEGFLDDYAAVIFAQLMLYSATLDEQYLKRAKFLCSKVISEFEDKESGGFYLYSEESETLILRPKETYDGAMPSGNSLMLWNLVKLWHITSEEEYEEAACRTMDFIAGEAEKYAAGYSMFLLALCSFYNPPAKVTAVVSDTSTEIKETKKKKWILEVQTDTVLKTCEPSDEYPLKNEKDTFYFSYSVCRGSIRTREIF